MRFATVAASAIALATLGSAAPAAHGGWGKGGGKGWGKGGGKGKNDTCVNPPVRKEWRMLTNVEKQDYIDAVLCLQTKEPVVSNPEAQNAFDDLHAVHLDQTPNIHWVGHFVLWHRYMVATYEKMLRERCGYKGAQPYWDWSRDAQGEGSTSMAIFETEIFDDKLGFGGNGVWVENTTDPFNIGRFGRTGGGCVDTGPFQRPNFSINVQEAELGSCLRRDMIPALTNWWAQRSLVQKVLDQPDYQSFARELEGNPTFDAPNIHGSGHFGTGGTTGQIGNAANSPADPLFYLHHGNIDHVFHMWQQQDPEARLHQVGGNIIAREWETSPNVTLDFEINMGEVSGTRTLHQLLDIQGEHLCYAYADDPSYA